MRDKPSPDDLLKIAEETFRQEILPALSADKKYTALMIANAMRIAARQIECDEKNIAQNNKSEITSLSKLLNVTIDTNSPEALLNLNKQFAVAIRAGYFAPDKDAHNQARQHLTIAVQNRLAEVNPKAIHPISPINPASGERNDRG